MFVLFFSNYLLSTSNSDLLLEHLFWSARSFIWFRRSKMLLPLFTYPSATHCGTALQCRVLLFPCGFTCCIKLFIAARQTLFHRVHRNRHHGLESWFLTDCSNHVCTYIKFSSICHKCCAAYLDYLIRQVTPLNRIAVTPW